MNTCHTFRVILKKESIKNFFNKVDLWSPYMNDKFIIVDHNTSKKTEAI